MSLPSSPSPPSSSRVSSSVLLSSVWQLLLHVFIPASLANEAARLQPQPAPLPLPTQQPPSPSPSVPAAAASSPLLDVGPAAELRSCDLVLVVTPGWVYREFRRLASHSYDHLAIALSAHSVLHVGPPTIRLLPASLLLQPRRQPLVLRPTLSEQQRAALVHSLTPLVGQPYDTMRVLKLIARLATAQTAETRRQRLHRVWSGQWQSQPLRKTALAGSAAVATLASAITDASPLSSFICTDAILNRLLAVSPQFRAIVDQWQCESRASALLPLDFHTMHSWSINDIHRIAHAAQPLAASLGDTDAPFFTPVLPPAYPASTWKRPSRLLKGQSSVNSASKAGSKLSSAFCSVLLLLCAYLLKRSVRATKPSSRRLPALLKFSLLFSSFLPPLYVMTVLLVLLTSLQQDLVSRLGNTAVPWFCLFPLSRYAKRSRL